jgi:uncharacterized protein (TIGR02145 family)
MKKLFITSSIIGVVLFGIIISSCEKDDTKPIFYNPSITYGNMTDQEGNTYKTVTIGTQTWMADNLRVTHYRNGDPITYISGGSEWLGNTEGAYCRYGNNSKNSKTYGKLYNWYAVDDSRNLCPTGWHVSTNSEWSIMIDYMGGESVAGDKLKETGKAHWDYDPDNDATNESGFSALPGGHLFGWQFQFVGAYGYWWTSTVATVYPESDSSFAWTVGMGYGNKEVFRLSSEKITGKSVRCVKDE